MRRPGLRERLEIAPEVAAALADGRSVVALESTLITHGLPFPANLEVAVAAEAAVRSSGAIPATVAIRDGRILVGLAHDALQALALAPDVRKAARPTLSSALAAGGWAGTTVSGTMIAAHAAGIGVFATGGIGGVHDGAVGGPRPTFDISSDLDELARTPVVVVCAGPKAILAVPATIEYLETRGVPVAVLGSDTVPGFFARSSGVPAPVTVADLDEAVRLIETHLGLDLGSGLLLCVPVPEDAALPADEAGAAIARATEESSAKGITGPALTPWLLARIGELTEGRSIRANQALIVNDAATAGTIATALSTGRAVASRRPSR